VAALNRLAFRVLIAGGGTSPTTRPCAGLDKLFTSRLPDVELLTAGGQGVPMRAASYATERGLKLTALVPVFGRFPAVAAVDRRDA
jgi:hypothetical protein